MAYTRTTLANTRSGTSIDSPLTFKIGGLGRAKIKSVDSADPYTVVFPFGPRDIKIDNRLAKITQIERPGMKPLLVVESPSLTTITFSATIADKASGGQSADYVEKALEPLYAISEEGYQCKFVYGLSSYPFIFRITKLTITEKIKDANGRTIRANVDIQLTESAPYNPELIDLDVVTFEPEVPPVIRESTDDDDDYSAADIGHWSAFLQDLANQGSTQRIEDDARYRRWPTAEETNWVVT